MPRREEFGKANVLQRDERAQTESMLAKLRVELESCEPRQATASALPSQIKSVVKLFEDLETRKAKAILKSAHDWTGGKTGLEFR